MLHLFSISGFINGITFAILGLLVFFKNPRRKLNRLYTLFSFSVVFWAISYGFWLLAKNYETGLFWARMLNFGSLFIPIFFAHWILTFLEIEKEKKNKIILILGYLVTLFFALFTFTPYYVSHVEPKLLFPYWPMPGILYHFYLLLGWGGLLSYTFYQLWKAYKKTSGYKKEQLKYVLVSGLIGFAGGGTNYFLWYNIPIAPWGNPLVLVWAIVFSYIVLRYRFMDIKVILTDILVGAMGIILVILPFVMPTDSLRALTLAVFLLFSVFAYYLIKATHEEAKRREEAERMAIQEKALRQKSEEMTRQEAETRKKEAEMRKKAEKIASREKQLKEEIGKLALEQKKLAEVHREIAEEKTRRMERIYSQSVQKELEVIELKKEDF